MTYSSNDLYLLVSSSDYDTNITQIVIKVNDTLYKKEIFLSGGETKVLSYPNITLPDEITVYANNCKEKIKVVDIK